MDQAKLSRGMAFVGLAFFGGASIAANVLSVNLPALEGNWDAANVATWQGLPKKTDVDGWAYFWATLFPIGALAGIEFVSRFTGLHKFLRYVVLGLASAVAVMSSYLHIVHVLLWYGQGVLISIVGPIAIDGLMILCTLQLLSTAQVADTADTGHSTRQDVAVPVPRWDATVMSPVPLGPVPRPVVPADRDNSQTDNAKDNSQTDNAKDNTVRTRGKWDRAEAAKLVMGTDLSNEEIGERVGTSYKTIQRLRREIKESEAMTERA